MYQSSGEARVTSQIMNFSTAIVFITDRFAVVSFSSLFFFFQAEDGIRDLTVTGVQTCALPISVGSDAAFERFGEIPKLIEGEFRWPSRGRRRWNRSLGDRRPNSCQSLAQPYPG